MKILGAIGAGLAIIILLIVATFLIVGSETFWRFFGDPDLGPVLFEHLERRSTPNDALACPPGLCKAKSDVTVPLYPKTAHDLRLAFSKVIASEPRVSVVDADDMTLTDRYIQRSRIFRLSRHDRRTIPRWGKRPVNAGDLLAVPAGQRRSWG
jgi:hypothetical protein